MAWPFDRRVAAATFAVSAAAIVATTVVAPGVAATTAGQGALDRFVALLDTGRRASASVTYSFERTLVDGRTLEGEIVAVQRPRFTVVSGMGTLSARSGDRQLHCTETEGRSGCLDRAAGSAREAGLLDTFDEVTRAGHYVVVDDGRRKVVGEEAECFALERVSEVPAPGAPRTAWYCLALDGIVLWAEVDRPAGVDTRIATTVRRPARDTDADELLDQFGAGGWRGDPASRPAGKAEHAVRAVFGAAGTIER